MDFYDYIYEQYLKDLESGETNLTWEEYLEYVLNNEGGVYTL